MPPASPGIALSGGPQPRCSAPVAFRTELEGVGKREQQPRGAACPGRGSLAGCRAFPPQEGSNRPACASGVDSLRIAAWVLETGEAAQPPPCPYSRSEPARCDCPGKQAPSDRSCRSCGRPG